MHEEAKEMEKKLSDIMCRIEECLHMGINAGALDKARVEDLPALTDMVKDMAQAKKYCAEAFYYSKIIEAMEKSEKEEEEWAKMGYNNRRYANGEYAPKGRGHISGFNPIMRERPYINAYMDRETGDIDMMRMGYPDEKEQHGGNHKVRMDHDGSYYDGESFFLYDDARRHYSESGSEKDREEMDERGMKHVKDSIKTFREIWEDADPMMRKELHKELSAAVAEMKP